ncbi:hypothetical protein PPTG_19634 [Phytophthora nicotianae INRA-310]|uniref:Uncharacterized protein n=1 Tax=Phytophthora nicotianae (strain INRA-310) TaxID=761204 RepID=W2PBI5_PHYN3|nr:hypothetical protein PPTG_19634 [Phytophthora nicotianae INRA-310]ETM98402.1 hypothetical protein PPTG_19634 [Phytophthora nicotianae INRA-310]
MDSHITDEETEQQPKPHKRRVYSIDSVFPAVSEVLFGMAGTTGMEYLTWAMGKMCVTTDAFFGFTFDADSDATNFAAPSSCFKHGRIVFEDDEYETEE